MQPIKGLIFDFDGLIIDTESPEFESWIELFAEYGAEIFFEEWVVCLGTNTSAFDPASLLLARAGIMKDNHFLWAEQKKRSTPKAASQPVLPGVLDLLKQAKHRGLRLAVASSSPYEWVSTHLQTRGLAPFFDDIITREQVEQVKPHPALFLKALDSLGLHPGEAIVLEDSPNGILAARAAGLYCVAVPNPISCRLDLSQANRILPSLAETSLDELVAFPYDNGSSPRDEITQHKKPSP